jgi:hypothetical protein
MWKNSALLDGFTCGLYWGFTKMFQEISGLVKIRQKQQEFYI